MLAKTQAETITVIEKMIARITSNSSITIERYESEESVKFTLDNAHYIADIQVWQNYTYHIEVINADNGSTLLIESDSFQHTDELETHLEKVIAFFVPSKDN